MDGRAEARIMGLSVSAIFFACWALAALGIY